MHRKYLNKSRDSNGNSNGDGNSKGNNDDGEGNATMVTAAVAAAVAYCRGHLLDDVKLDALFLVGWGFERICLSGGSIKYAQAEGVSAGDSE